VTSRYSALADYLGRRDEGSLRLGFGDVERVVGRLPDAARNYRAWWSNSPSHTHAKHGWLAAGWRVSAVDMKAESLSFVRQSGAAAHASAAGGIQPSESSDPGAGNLGAVVDAIERYIQGDITETELGRLLRKHWRSQG
jgi:hypothetical protein